MPATDFSSLLQEAASNLDYTINTTELDPKTIAKRYGRYAWDFDIDKPKLDSLISKWGETRDKVRKAREDRLKEVDVKSLRRTGELAPDETLIVKNLIDKNIRRNIAPYMQFVKGPNRSIKLSCVSDTKVDPALLERDYTTLARYKDWEIGDYRTCDSAENHGWAAVETCFDLSRPGNFYHKFIACDRLLFPFKASDLQSCEALMVELDTTAYTLNKSVKHLGFDQDVVDAITAFDVKDKNEFAIYKIFHFFYRSEIGIIFHGFYSTLGNTWLKSPSPLWLGKTKLSAPAVSTEGFGPVHLPAIDEQSMYEQYEEPEFETEYPIDIYIPYMSEDDVITNSKGRAFFDLPTQVAMTCLWSSFINKLIRSSNVYGSPKNANPEQIGVPKLMNAGKFVNCGMYDNGVDFWSMPAPDQTWLAGARALSGENSDDNNQISFTVLNRPDARKTKKEMELAESTQSSVNSVGLMLWSSFQRSKHTRSFEIVQNRARSGKITDFLKPESEQDITNRMFKANPQTTPEEVQATVAREDKARIMLLSQTYEVFAAGDSDVLEREEKLKKLEAFWPIIQQSGAASFFIKKMAAIAFPEDADEITALLDATNPKDQAIKSLGALIEGLIKEFGAQIPPEQLKQLTDTLNQSAQLAQRTY